MPDAQLPLPLDAPHRNHLLFADDYLNHVLPREPGWAALAEEGRAAMRALADRLAACQPAALNEAQLEHQWIRPILALLGHHFEVQPSLVATQGASVRPDYAFFRDAAALAARQGSPLTDAFPREGGIAVGDAKQWDRPLDTAEHGRPSFENRNPSYQIFYYLLHSGAEWGILTNGRLWRLYHKETAHKLDRYYEVDLPALLAGGDEQRFLYFYAFFRRAAFDDAPLGLSRILAASSEYARRVGDSLREQVYEALRHLAQGFLDYAPNQLQPDAPTLKAIYDHSLILLYRLIFLQYAEARELLPVRESEMYRATYSLYAIKRQVRDDLASGRRMLSGSAILWPRLQQLFEIINDGSPPLHVATYNGGLFDPERYPFLARCAVGDSHLQQAIDRIARVRGEFVDYRDLSVRHMGTIYEGLLEYRLESIPPEGGWTVDLAGDRSERKATGSYYTPDYIVKYIVEQAVGPVLREAVAGQSDDDARVQAILGLNVLDPAMGSGHFLVEATEYIAGFLVDLGAAPEEGADGEADLAHWKRRVVQSCIYGVDLNPLAVELAKLSLWLTTVARDRPLSFLDHHLRPGNSLVGAGLEHIRARNPEPARRRGKSRAQQAEAEGQTSMTSVPGFVQSMKRAVGNMWLIERMEGDTVGAVKRQEALYETLRREFTQRYGRLADLVTATHFGLDVDEALWKPLAAYAAGEHVAAFPAFDALLARAEEIAERERFFHWELEFPEVYFDEFGRPRGAEAGFEAVIGNPPYVRQEQLAPYKPFFAQDFADVYDGTADLFVYFFAQGLRQAARSGRLSYISSNSWLRANYAGPLRRVLRTTATVETLVDLDDHRVFEGALDVYPAIHVVRKEAPPAEHTARAAVFARAESLHPFESRVAEKLFSVTIHDQADSGWQLSGTADRGVFAKLMAAGRPLAEVVEGRIYYGIKTGLNEAFIIDTETRNRLVAADPASSGLIRVLVNGEDVRPWYTEDEGRWLILLPDGWTRAAFGEGLAEADAWEKLVSRHGALAAHLAPFAEPARKRADQGSYWWELRPCSYYHEFDGRKLFWPEMAKQPRFALVEPGIICNKTAFMTPVSDPFLLGALMSRPSWFLVSRLCVAIGERRGMLRYTLSAQFISRLPIPDAPAAEGEAIGALAMAITEKARARYALHRRARHRLLSDLGAPGKGLNLKLTAWWDLDFAGLRAEVRKVFKHDVPVAERDEWEAWLDARRAEHRELTEGIVRLETELNARVYALFDLTAEEIRLIEESTKYRYGEV